MYPAYGHNLGPFEPILGRPMSITHLPPPYGDFFARFSSISSSATSSSICFS